MNCKPGDLAVVVRCEYTPEMIGMVVTVVRAYTGESIDGVRWGLGADRQRWVIEGSRPLPSRGWHGEGPIFTRQRSMPDSAMRPIRDSDGQDETLRIAGLPAPLAEREHAGG